LCILLSRTAIDSQDPTPAERPTSKTQGSKPMNLTQITLQKSDPGHPSPLSRKKNYTKIPLEK